MPFAKQNVEFSFRKCNNLLCPPSKLHLIFRPNLTENFREQFQDGRCRWYSTRTHSETRRYEPRRDLDDSILAFELLCFRCQRHIQHSDYPARRSPKSFKNGTHSPIKIKIQQDMHYRSGGSFLRHRYYNQHNHAFRYCICWCSCKHVAKFCYQLSWQPCSINALWVLASYYLHGCWWDLVCARLRNSCRVFHVIAWRSRFNPQLCQQNNFCERHHISVHIYNWARYPKSRLYQGLTPYWLCYHERNTVFWPWLSFSQ